MTDKQIIIDGIDVSKCWHRQGITCIVSQYDFCDKHPNCYYKQLKRKEQKLERIINMLFTGQCSNCEGYSPNCSNKELCNFKHNIKNIIDEVENEN